MIVVRNIFQIRAGSMKQAVEQVKRGQALINKDAFPKSRILTDVVGDFYTLVLETECESLSDFEQGIGSSFGSQEWQAWYQEFTPMIECGRREIFRVVE